jgi:hypothetical protein
MNWKIAKNAARNVLLLLALIGLVVVISFIVYSKPITMIPSLLGIGFAWFLLYRLEIAWREHRLRKGWY